VNPNIKKSGHVSASARSEGQNDSCLANDRPSTHKFHSVLANARNSRDKESCLYAQQANMYKHFFGLRENPFKINPDPRYLFLTPQTQEALDNLTYGIQTRQGLILLTGEVGTGKTTLINHLLDWLHQQRAPTAFIFNSRLETRHLFDFVLADFGVPFDSRTNDNALKSLNQWLVERYRAGDNPVLIVDEAQGLSFELLEEIRLLLNLENQREKLLQVVLVGQPELEEKLKQYELRQLRQRITLRCKTAPFTSEETRAYIQARLHIAGSSGNPVFAPEAMDALHCYSRGIPRVINLLCEHSLINAYADNLQPVPAGIVEEVAHEFQFDEAKRPVSPGDTADAQSISAKVPTAPPSAAEPAWEAQSSRGMTGVSVQFAIAKPTTLPNCESSAPPLASERTSGRIGGLDAIENATVRLPPSTSTEAVQGETERLLDSTESTSEDAFQLLSELALKSLAITSAPLLHRDESRSDFDLSAASQRSLVSRLATSTLRPITNGATMQFPQGSSRKQSRNLRDWPIRWSAWWTMRWSSIASSPGRTRLASTLLRWLKPVMNPVLPMLGQMPGRLLHSRTVQARDQFGHKKV
jgi:general secretion pathway protein A